MLRLFGGLRPHRFAILAVMALILLQSISQLYLPNLMSRIVDIGIVDGNIPFIINTGLRMLLVAAIGAACVISAGFLSARTGSFFSARLREQVFSRVSSYSLHEFSQLGTASLITRTTNDIVQMQQVVTMGLRMGLMTPLMLVGGVFMAISKNPQLSLLLVAILPVLFLVIWLVATKGMPLFQAIQTKLDKLSRVLREHLTGVRVIRAFNRTHYEETRFAEANADLTDTSVRVQRLMAVINPLFMLMFNFMTIAVIWFGGKRVELGSLQVGDLMAFVQYAAQILNSLIMLSMMFVMFPRAQVAADRINEVLDMVPSIHDPHKPVATTEQGGVEFRNVVFSYPGAEHPVLDDISFLARPAEITAIIGGTGSGKTTLLNLIMRFFDVDEGQVFVGGVDVRQQTQEALRQQIGLVPQRALLFTGSVADNIRFGKGDASRTAVEQAAQIAQASDFVQNMNGVYDANITQGGTNVSGGQRQRLAIARALVRRPDIYLFDDSFSALDFKTDARLRAALKQETAEATILIVAQRVSTVMDAHQIIVLDAGRIVGKGTHRELVKSCPVYREIVASQLSEEELA